MRNRLITAAWLVLSSHAGGVMAVEGLDRDGLYQSSPPGDLITAARSIIAKDPFPALISLDGQGMPRVRTVELRPLEDDLEFWVATKPNTRKVSQIRGNPEVSLYFSVDAEGSYVSVMGTAVLHDTEKTKTARSWRTETARSALWPDFPDDYLLIEIKPIWIEVIGAGVAARISDWRPQAVVIAK